MTDDDAESREWVEDPEVKNLLRDRLDETDYLIIKELSKNGRMSDTELADQIGVSRSSARRRRKKLQNNGILDIRAVIILQEGDFSHADVRVKYSLDTSQEEVEELIEYFINEPLVFEMAEQIGEYDLLLRVWHSSMDDIKSYLRQHLHNHPVVESYDISPVTKSYKLWFQDFTSSEGRS